MLLTFLENMIAPVFYKLLYMSITALVVGMIIILIRRFADKLFSPFWKYVMWVLVLAALVMPWRPQSNIAVMNTTQKIQEISFRDEYVAAQTEYQQSAINEAGDKLIYEPSKPLIEAKAKADLLHVKTLIFDSIIPAMWFIGMVVIGLFMVLSGLRLDRKIKSSTISTPTERYENKLKNCKNKPSINRRVQIVLQEYVKTPALFGLFRPKIILPSYVENLGDEHLEYVILHELFHLKRGDGIINTLMLVLQTVYWFNPLTWILFKFIREDMELANDAAVLKGMGVEEQKEYSLSLVEVLAGYSKPALTSRLLCMVDSEKNMERRINMIKLGEFFKRRKLIIAISALVVIALIGTLFLTVGANSSKDIPNMYLSDSDGNEIELVRFGYHWNFGSTFAPKETIADAMAPFQYEYSGKNTIMVKKQAVLTLSGKKGKLSKNYKNALSYTIWKPDGTIYDNGHREMTDSLSPRLLKDNGGRVILIAPFELGEYIYSVELDFDRGKVIYGFKLTVSDNVAPNVTMRTDQTVYSPDVSKIKVTWNNNTNKEFIFGETFWLEEKTDGIWRKAYEKDAVFNTIGLPVKAHDSREHTYDIRVYTDTLKSGNYRIAARYIDSRAPGDYDEYPVYAEFRVDNSSNIPRFTSLSEAATILKTRPVGTDPWNVYYASPEYVYLTYSFGHEFIYRYNVKLNRIDKALNVNPDNVWDWSAGSSFYADGKKAYIYPGVPEIIDPPLPNRSVYLIDFETDSVSLISKDNTEFILPSDIKYYQPPENDSVYGDTYKKYKEAAEKDFNLPKIPSDWCNIIEIQPDIYVLIMPSDAKNAWPGNGYAEFKIIVVDTKDVKSMQTYEIRDLGF